LIYTDECNIVILLNPENHVHDCDNNSDDYDKSVVEITAAFLITQCDSDA